MIWGKTGEWRKTGIQGKELRKRFEKESGVKMRRNSEMVSFLKK